MLKPILSLVSKAHLKVAKRLKMTSSLGFEFGFVFLREHGFANEKITKWSLP